MISVLIVDDEKLARERIKFLLKDEDDIKICAESSNGLAAIKDIQIHNPDIVFLDIQMPEKNGFEVLQEIFPEAMPAIIFVTAYDKYAIDAFEVSAIDYLLKPFDEARFLQALNRAKISTQNKTATAILQRFLEKTFIDRKYCERFSVKNIGRIYFVDAKEIIVIKAAGKYVELCTMTDSHLLRKSISLIEKDLDPNIFLRVHRSAIVNILEISEMQHWHKGEYIFILKNGAKIISSNSYKENIQKLV